MPESAELILQFGFAGVLLFVLWNVAKFIKLGFHQTEEMTKVVQNNTHALENVCNSIEKHDSSAERHAEHIEAAIKEHEGNSVVRSKDHGKTVSDLEKRLLSRPCLLPEQKRRPT